MAGPKGDLKQLLAKSNGAVTAPEPELETVGSGKSAKSQRCPARQGKKMVTGYFDVKAHRQLKQLSLETDKSIQVLLGDALNMLFTFHDKPPIA